MIKKVAIAILIVTIASLSVAGCTSPTTTNPTPNATTSNTSSSDDMSSRLTAYFTNTKGETIVQPFTQTTVSGHTAYVGSFKDGDNKLTPKIHNYTVIVANSNTDAKQLFAQQVNATKKAGYVEITPTLDTQWHGYYQTRASSANGEVFVTVCEPHSCTVSLSNEFVLADPSSFVVTVDKSKAA